MLCPINACKFTFYSIYINCINLTKCQYFNPSDFQHGMLVNTYRKMFLYILFPAWEDWYGCTNVSLTWKFNVISNISGHFLIAPGVIFEKPVISLLQSFGKNNNFKRIINSKKKKRELILKARSYWFLLKTKSKATFSSRPTSSFPLSEYRNFYMV